MSNWIIEHIFTSTTIIRFLNTPRMKHFLKLVFLLLLIGGIAFAQKKNKKKEVEKEETSLLNSETLAGIKFRNIGPAFTSGRIADFAVREEKPSEYYVAVASGGVWKTVNSGTTWQPIFDSQGIILYWVRYP